MAFYSHAKVDHAMCVDYWKTFWDFIDAWNGLIPCHCSNSNCAEGLCTFARQIRYNEYIWTLTTEEHFITAAVSCFVTSDVFKLYVCNNQVYRMHELSEVGTEFVHICGKYWVRFMLIKMIVDLSPSELLLELYNQGYSF